MEPFAGDFENYAYKILIKEPVKKEQIDSLYKKMIDDINGLYGKPNSLIVKLYGSEEQFNYQRIKNHTLFSEYDKLQSRYKNALYLKNRVQQGFYRIVAFKIFIHEWILDFLHNYYKPEGKGYLKGKKSWEDKLNTIINT